MSDDVALAQRLAFLQIDTKTRDTLRALRSEVENVLPGVLDQFYEHIRSEPQVARFFGVGGGSGDMSGAKSRQITHWLLILTGEFDATYVESVRKIGLMHAKIGLEPRWYIAGYSFITSRLLQHVVTARAANPFSSKVAQATMLDALTKAVMLDMDFAISIYLEEGEKQRLEIEQRAEVERVESEKTRKRELNELATSFEASVSGIVETVASAARELNATARSMSQTADLTTERSTTVSAAAEEATANVSVVASSAEQMGNSVQEISEQVSHSARIAAEAVSRAQTTNQTVESLSKAAEKIGEVVNMISDIAEQTNLLALNATIESARAGEAGRGFAVVASEVKTLATQTAKATEDIASQIEDMQSITSQSVEAIAAIRATIDEMSEVSVAINAAVEEQAAATQEIARNTQEAAVGTQDVSRNIAGVMEGANETGAASSQVVSASDELGQQAERLRAEVQRFLDTVRAA